MEDFLVEAALKRGGLWLGREAPQTLFSLQQICEQVDLIEGS